MSLKSGADETAGPGSGFTSMINGGKQRPSVNASAFDVSQK